MSYTIQDFIYKPLIMIFDEDAGKIPKLTKVLTLLQDLDIKFISGKDPTYWLIRDKNWGQTANRLIIINGRLMTGALFDDLRIEAHFDEFIFDMPADEKLELPLCIQ